MQFNLRLMLLAMLAGGLMSMSIACSDLEEDCDPAVDEGCVCTLDETGAVVDDCIDNETDDGEACACTLEDGDDDENNDVNNDENNDVNNDENNDAPQFRFVLIQDDTPAVNGETPGSDIDTAGLIKGDGSGEFFATTVSVESDVPCDGNSACDTSAMTGAPDVVNNGECFGGGGVDTTLFTSLNQGFAIVSFSGGGNGDQVIENGDAIHVYEIGATECGRFDDDPYSVSVGVSDTDTGSFIEIGAGAAGDNIIEVSGL